MKKKLVKKLPKKYCKRLVILKLGKKKIKRVYYYKLQTRARQKFHQQQLQQKRKLLTKSQRKKRFTKQQKWKRKRKNQLRKQQSLQKKYRPLISLYKRIRLKIRGTQDIFNFKTLTPAKYSSYIKATKKQQKLIKSVWKRKRFNRRTFTIRIRNFKRKKAKKKAITKQYKLQTPLFYYLDRLRILLRCQSGRKKLIPKKAWLKSRKYLFRGSKAKRRRFGKRFRLRHYKRPYVKFKLFMRRLRKHKLKLKKYPSYHILVRKSRNNIFVTALNPLKQVIYNTSAGMNSFLGPRRSTVFAAERVGINTGTALKGLSFGPCFIILKTKLNRHVKRLIVGLCQTFKNVKGILDLIPISHNGMRKRKKRRL